MPDSSTSIGDRQKLAGLFRFAGGLLAASERAHFTMAEHKLGVFREREVKGLPGVHLDTPEGDWLRVERLREEKPPLPEEAYADWIDTDLGNPEVEPLLREIVSTAVGNEEASDLVEAGLVDPDEVSPVRLKTTKEGVDIVDPDRVQVVLRLERMPEFRAAFERWVATVWRPWAEQERPRRKTIRLYKALYELHNRMHAGTGGVIPELVWGIGLYRWKPTDKPATIDLPVIEYPVDLILEEGGALSVRPRRIGPSLSLRAFMELEVPEAARAQAPMSERLERRLKDQDVQFSPFDPFGYEDILQACADRLSAKGRFVSQSDIETGHDIEPAGPDLAVYSTWTLFGRPRSEDARRQDIAKLCGQIESKENDEELPQTLRGFVSVPPDEPADGVEEWGLSRDPSGATTSWGGDSGTPSVPADSSGALKEKKGKRDYYFPLAYNDEQAEIIDRLDERGVAVVTGPPGTGKTHTIANVISHYMANGKRVLVTARTAEAISAVQEKLPEDLRPMTIAVVHSDREGAKQLQTAVTALADEAAMVKPHEKKEVIRELMDRVRRLDEEIADRERRINEIARRNLEQVSYAGESLLPMDLAERLGGERERYGWFPDRPAPGLSAGVDETLIGNIRRLRDELGEDLVYLGVALPKAADLPETVAIISAHRSLREEACRPVENLSDAPVMTWDSADAEEKAWELRQAFTEIDEGLKVLGEAWLREYYAERLRARLGKEGASAGGGLSSLVETLEGLAGEIREAGVRELSLPATIGDRAAFDQAVEAFARGENPLGLGASIFRRSLVREIGEVRIDGAKPAWRVEWQVVIRQRKLAEDIAAFARAWTAPEGAYVLPEIPAESGRAAETIAELATKTREACRLAEAVPDLLSRLQTFFPYGLNAEEDLLGARCDAILRAFRANLDSGNKGPPPAVAKLLEASGGTTPLFRQMEELAECIGREGIDERMLVEARGALTKEIGRLEKMQPRLASFGEAVSRIAAAGAPEWARMIATPDADTGSVLPDDWTAAWAWAEAMTRVEALNRLENPAKLREERAEFVRRREAAFKRLIREKTLLGLHQKLTGSIRQALAQFTTAVQRLGKGTGLQAGRWRRAIQESAMEAAPAAPVWIMPEYRVCEQLPPKLADFDLVVLDEASQSDVTAIAALARGKRLLIVGDEQQVSPTAVGIPVARVDALRAEFLRGLKNADQIDPETSIFDLARQMFPQAHVMLREHFRCVTPIIQFSTQFYENRLVPLRLPKASERLDPPLVDIYVPHGQKKGHLNEAEMEVVVEEIAKIVNDPASAGRPIGVISLIGSEQAQALHRRLIEHPLVGHEGIENHRIVCGDSRTLQGQERDIVFLSMVASPGQAKAQTTRTTAQRLNVAMSRARDRVYLVRSVDLHHLSPLDYKHKVLEHFRNPMPEGRLMDGKDVLDRCDSGFERTVCKRLLDAGYRVRSQVEVGPYRIDLVVDGPEDRRLAVELDGDSYHGPDRWADDTRRQAALERAGWTFWRVFGSQWNGDPEYWWSNLVETLDRLGIPPIGAERSQEVFVELRTIAPKGEERLGSETEVASEKLDAEIAAAPVPEMDAESKAATVLAPLPQRPAAPSGGDWEMEASGPQRPMRLVGRSEQPDRPNLGNPPPEEMDFGDTEPGSGIEPAFGIGEDAIADVPSLTVQPGCRVTIRWADTNKTQTLLISTREDRPSEGVIHVGKPLAEALLDAEAEEEIEFVNETGQARTLIVEAIFPALEIAE